MSNRWWDGFKIYIYCKIAELLPDAVKRQVLYIILERVLASNKNKQRSTDNESYLDEWSITFEQLYLELND